MTLHGDRRKKRKKGHVYQEIVIQIDRAILEICATQLIFQGTVKSAVRIKRSFQASFLLGA